MGCRVLMGVTTESSVVGDFAGGNAGATSAPDRWTRLLAGQQILRANGCASEYVHGTSGNQRIPLRATQFAHVSQPRVSNAIPLLADALRTPSFRSERQARVHRQGRTNSGTRNARLQVCAYSFSIRRRRSMYSNGTVLGDGFNFTNPNNLSNLNR